MNVRVYEQATLHDSDVCFPQDCALSRNTLSCSGSPALPKPLGFTSTSFLIPGIFQDSDMSCVQLCAYFFLTNVVILRSKGHTEKLLSWLL